MSVTRPSDMREQDAWLTEAFTNPVTREPYTVPDDIRRAATRIVMAYGIRGICDPMYIANVIANETGRGDGQSNFWPTPIAGVDYDPAVCDACGKDEHTDAELAECIDSMLGPRRDEDAS